MKNYLATTLLNIPYPDKRDHRIEASSIVGAAAKAARSAWKAKGRKRHDGEMVIRVQEIKIKKTNPIN